MTLGYARATFYCDPILKVVIGCIPFFSFKSEEMVVVGGIKISFVRVSSDSKGDHERRIGDYWKWTHNLLVKRQPCEPQNHNRTSQNKETGPEVINSFFLAENRWNLKMTEHASSHLLIRPVLFRKLRPWSSGDENAKFFLQQINICIQQILAPQWILESKANSNHPTILEMI